MNEPNTSKTSKAPEFAGGGALNALHNARAEIRAIHPEGAEGVEITVEGPGAGLLAIYSAITQDLMEVMTKQAHVPPLVAAKMLYDAAAHGIAGLNTK